MAETSLLRTATIASLPDTAHHTLQTLPGSGTAQMPVGSFDHVLLTFRQNTAGGVRVADNTTVADIVVVHWHGSGDDAVISGQVAVSSHPLYQPLAAFVPPGHTFWVYMGAVGSPGTNATTVNIHWTPIRKPS
jgi:hypothetical protein